jgi:sugar lactone lactonase YvrE
MSFPNGIVMAADGRSLYVAHTEGISLVDPGTGARTLLPAAGSVHGIDGLLLKDGVLYGVQNSPYLHRVVAAALAPDGRSIGKVWTVNSRTPAEYIQTTAAIAGDDLYMVGGNPALDLYGGTNPAKPVGRIWRVPLKD